MPLHLRWKDATRLPVEVPGLTPEGLGRLAPGELVRKPVRFGNGSAALGDLFDVQGDLGDGRLVLEGDLRSVRGIGQAMTSGHLTVAGDAGSRLGAGMAGGVLEVEGSAGDWAGAEMSAGLLRIGGRAGDHLGAAFPGSRVGMRGGAIVVHGPAGDDVGVAMRRGVIAIGGDAGETLGRAMVAGSIFAFAGVGRRAGLHMKRGTIVLWDAGEETLLPTFAPSGRSRPPFLAIYLRQIRAWGLEPAALAFAGPWRRYNGDVAEGGQGEILVGSSNEAGGR